jgi:neopullulanase
MMSDLLRATFVCSVPLWWQPTTHTKPPQRPRGHKGYTEAKSFGTVAVVCFLILLTPQLSLSQSPPQVFKVDPPSWFVRHSINPVRLLIHGRNLQGARIQAVDPGLRLGVPKINSAGSYIFVDAYLTAQMKAGVRRLKITTADGTANADFEILNPLPRAGRFAGFSPDDVLYLAMIDRFSDGDTTNNDPPQSRGLYDRDNKYYYHGGDLQGVIDRLPYLKDLGITAIWLTPWYDNYDRLNEIELKEGKPCTGFHGYNPQDFYKVEEHFGTLAKLQELVSTAHQVGIKIIQDAVVNHTGPYHPWVNDEPTPTWFNGTRQNHLANVFQTWVLHDPRPVAELKKATMEGWFLDFLPDLNQHDSEVERYLIQNTLWWIGITGLDGIRMDTWQYVPNTFWNKWNAAIKREYPKFTVVGEVKDGDVVHTSYFQGGTVRDGTDSRLDSLLDFPLFYPIRHSFGEGKNVDEIPKTLAKDFLYTDPNILVTLLGGHDDGRFMSEKDATIAGLKLANVFVLTTRGVPQLYYGDEIGMEGPDEPATRADFPGGFPGDKRNAFTSQGRTREQQELFAYVRKVVRLHTELLPLRRGELINLHVANQQFVYARRHNMSSVIIAINNDTKAAEISFQVEPLRLASGTRLVDRVGTSVNVVVNDQQLKINLPARTAYVLVPQ